MAVSLKHKFTSAKPDSGDSSLIRPSNWNDEHDLTIASSRLVGRTTAGAGPVEEISVGSGLSLSAGSLAVNTAGAVVGTTDTQTLTNKTISGGVYSGTADFTGSQRSGITAVGALDINCSLGNYFTKTISANSTFTFSSAPASRAYSFTLELTHTSGTVTWPTSVQWPAGTAPTLTTGKTHLFMFVTDDAGTRWRGAALADYTN